MNVAEAVTSPLSHKDGGQVTGGNLAARDHPVTLPLAHHLVAAP